MEEEKEEGGGVVVEDRRKRRTIEGGSLKGFGVAEASGEGGQQWDFGFGCVLSPDAICFFFSSLVPKRHCFGALQEMIAGKNCRGSGLES
ncbi:unnamed protein product [Camellia sinensis]